MLGRELLLRLGVRLAKLLLRRGLSLAELLPVLRLILARLLPLGPDLPFQRHALLRLIAVMLLPLGPDLPCQVPALLVMPGLEFTMSGVPVRRLVTQPRPALMAPSVAPCPECQRVPPPTAQ